MSSSVSSPSGRVSGRPSGPSFPTTLLLPPSMVREMLRLYDYPHPHRPGAVIVGYDKAHALRTAKMCAAVSRHLAHDPSRHRSFHVACLLHDLGRAGLDRRLFGSLWSWAREHNVPTRPAEWRLRHPRSRYGGETEAFVRIHGRQLADAGLPLNEWTREHIEMRLGFARRHRRQLKRAKPTLNRLGIVWLPWMERVTLYYYYPETLAKSPWWARELGEILVACEQLEAYSNRRRGGDYYARARESFAEAFDYLDTLRRRGRVRARVVKAVRRLTASGIFDPILKAARGGALSSDEQRFLRAL